MKVVVVGYGTEGDVRPLAVFCRALIDAGHEATLLADGATLDSAERLSVPAAPLAGDIKGALGTVIAGGKGFGHTAKALARIANAHASDWLRTVVEVGDGCDVVVASGLAAFVGLSAAERLGVAALGAGMIPITPTREFPSPFLANAHVPRFANRASHLFVNAMLWRAFRKATNKARAEVGLPPRRKVWTSHPMLYGISPSLVPQPADWPTHARICGQWVEPDGDWTPPPELAAFLAAGEPPVYVGFGSMVGFDRARLRKAVVGAAAGRRVLWQPGWSGVETDGLPDNIHFVGPVPHGWLFPRVALAVHHGGSGTSHSAVRAGVPSVVVPFAGDQAFWAGRLQAAGVAPAPVRKLTATRLSAAIDAAGHPSMRAAAQDLAGRMATEDGPRNAVRVMEAMVGRLRRTG